MHSQEAIDVWTVVHHLYGAYFASVFGLSLPQAVVVACAWEIFENSSVGIATWNDEDYAGDSLKNTIVDIIAVASGWLVAAEA